MPAPIHKQVANGGLLQIVDGRIRELKFQKVLNFLRGKTVVEELARIDGSFEVVHAEIIANANR